MKNKVLSIKQMQHLQELGVDTSNASLFYVPKFYPKGEYSIHVVKPNQAVRSIPTFTLHDIIEMLLAMAKWRPLLIVGNAMMYNACYGECYAPTVVFQEGTLLESAYQMLCWCAEKGYLNENKNDHEEV